MKSNILTLFGIGKIKFGASLASIVALGFFIIISKINEIGYALNTTVLLLIAFVVLISLHKNKTYARKDPKEIVIDEFIGMYLLLIIVNATSIFLNIFFLLAFRTLDIIKPPPFSYIEKKFSNEYGVIIDDVAIGISIGALYLLIIYFFF